MESDPNQFPQQPTPPQPNEPNPPAEQPFVQPDVVAAPAAPAPVDTPVAPAAPQAVPVQPPAPQPAASPFPAQPIGSSPGSTYTPHKGPSKGLIFGLIGGIGGVILLIVGGLLLFMMLGVSKADYQEAYEAVSDVRDSYTDMSSVYLSANSTATELKNGVEKLKESKQTFDANYERLANLKAVKSDSDMAAAFKKLDAKKPKFDTAIYAATEAYEKILPALSDSTSSSSSSTQKLREIRTSLEGISGLEDENNKDLVSKLIASLTKLESLSEKVEAGRANWRVYDSTAVTAYYDEYKNFSNAIDDWQSNLDKMADEGEIADEINDLGQTATNKLNSK